MDSALQQITDRVRAAAAHGTPLRIRGGGTKDFYGQTLQGELLETASLAGIRSYEPTELVITAGAGTPLAELEAVLAERGQCLPFEPPRFGAGGTVGGMVAAGLSGPARASAGAVKDFVLGLAFVNGKGEHLVFGGQVMKNVAGYDVSRMMAGALGTLGVLTELSLKVLPMAPAEATLRFACSQAEALQWLNAWGAQPLPLNASCWVNDGGNETLYLRLRGAVAAVEAACASLRAERGGERLDNGTTAPDWALCRDLRLPWFTERIGSQDNAVSGLAAKDLWRLSVPQTAAVLDLPEAPLVEWHGAQRWVAASVEDGARVRAAAAAAGGHAVRFVAGAGGEGQGMACFDTLKPPLDRIHRALKREFDPAGIFNRGRMYADL